MEQCCQQVLLSQLPRDVRHAPSCSQHPHPWMLVQQQRHWGWMRGEFLKDTKNQERATEQEIQESVSPFFIFQSSLETGIVQNIILWMIHMAASLLLCPALYNMLTVPPGEAPFLKFWMTSIVGYLITVWSTSSVWTLWISICAFRRWTPETTKALMLWLHRLKCTVRGSWWW